MNDRFDADDKMKKGTLARGCWREAGRREACNKPSARLADDMEVSHLQLWMNRSRTEVLAQEQRERVR